MENQDQTRPPLPPTLGRQYALEDKPIDYLILWINYLHCRILFLESEFRKQKQRVEAATTTADRMVSSATQTDGGIYPIPAEIPPNPIRISPTGGADDDLTNLQIPDGCLELMERFSSQYIGTSARSGTSSTNLEKEALS